MRDFHKSLLKTALAIIILVVLVIYAYFGEYKKAQEEATKKEEELKVLKDVKKEEIVQIKITHKDNKTIELVKENDKFVIKSPIQTETDKNVVDTILNTLETLKSTTKFKDNERLSSYGLTTPSLILEYRLSNGNSRKLLCGLRNDFDGKYYMKLEDSDEIFMVEGYIKGNLDKDLYNLRDKSIFKVETNEIKKIEYKLGELVYIFEQKDKNWEMLSPERVRADDDEINRLKNSIKNLSAKAFHEDNKNLSEFGLDNATDYLKIYKGQDMSVSLINISKIKDSAGNEKVYVMRQNTNVPIEVDNSFYKDLDKKPFDYTFKKILDFERDSIFKIELIDGETKYSFVKEQMDTGSDWYLAEDGAKKKLKYYKVSSLLYFLADTKATKMIPSNQVVVRKYNLDKPQKAIIIYDSMSKEIGRVEFGTKETEGVPLLSSVRDDISFIETKKFEDVSFNINDYLEEARQDAGQ
ncbi:MAG: DUF4340 domain-containing protein [Deltaproteobacteria bacterium]|nr:DUF4340 domain-containing protein [Deltaproteobacteria bacterium]